MTRYILSLFSILSLLVFSPTQSHAQDFTEAQKTEINKMFKDYLLNNGSVILESVNKYQAELEEKDRKEAAVKAKEFMNTLKDQKDLAMAGNPKGDITIVEFFDYNCGYCRKALEEIQTVLKDDKNVKVVFKDMPILGPPSLEAAKWSLAAIPQGKYFEYHTAILNHNGPKDAQSLESIAKKIGLDVKKLKEDKDDPAIEARLNDQVEAARNVGINGTPGFIIAGEVYPGYMPAAQIETIIKEARKK